MAPLSVCGSFRNTCTHTHAHLATRSALPLMSVGDDYPCLRARERCPKHVLFLLCSSMCDFVCVCGRPFVRLRRY